MVFVILTLRPVFRSVGRLLEPDAAVDGSAVCRDESGQSRERSCARTRG